jgi:3-methyladenine DNA glycosylase AlkD
MDMTITSLGDLKTELEKLNNPEQARFLSGFFKTGPGQYGEGDCFRGIRVPVTRKLAKSARGLPLSCCQALLHSKWHEDRFVALIMLIEKYRRGDDYERKKIFELYIKERAFINNWDLVDVSAHEIVGRHLFDYPGKIRLLEQLCKSPKLWDRRIAMIASYYFIKQNKPALAIKLALKLLKDKEDLMHKAVGWMLREIGKRCGRNLLTDFLDKHAGSMPRTALRYAIEHLSKTQRIEYMRR